ncbi:MAG: hypothetical protein ACXWQ5_00715 [Ktedonobacterales bacterium]
MTTLKALWTEIVHANVAWYDEYVARLEADMAREGIQKPKALARAHTEERQRLLGYSETKLPRNQTQLFYMAGVFRGYRGLAQHITDIEGRRTFILMFARGAAEGLDNALRWHEDGTYDGDDSAVA